MSHRCPDCEGECSCLLGDGEAGECQHECAIGCGPDSLLSLDPASYVTGYALFNAPNHLEDAGCIRATSRDAPPMVRILDMAADVEALVLSAKPARAVVEITSGKTARRFEKQRIAGLGVYGMAVGVLYHATIKAMGSPERVHWVIENDWTGGVPKKARQRGVAATFPQYAAFARARDRGADAADAIGLGAWWYGQQVVKKASMV